MNKSHNRECVLVIEDDAAISELLGIVLTRQGYDVQSAPDCATATSALESSEPSIVLLDIMLPDGNGLDLLRWIRDDLHRTMPVLVLTAFRQEEKALKAFELGATDFLSKPFRPRELLARVERALSDAA